MQQLPPKSIKRAKILPKKEKIAPKLKPETSQPLPSLNNQIKHLSSDDKQKIESKKSKPRTSQSPNLPNSLQMRNAKVKSRNNPDLISQTITQTKIIKVRNYFSFLSILHIV